jgi:hypothetical protein
MKYGSLEAEINGSELSEIDKAYFLAELTCGLRLFLRDKEV